MNVRLTVSSALFSISFCTQAVASCDAILANGFRNIQYTFSAETAIARKYYQNCGKISRDVSDDVLANAEVEIFGYGKGDGRFSRDQRIKDLNQWCNINEEAANKSKDAYSQSDTVYAESVSAWRDCNALQKNQVETDPSITDGAKHVGMAIRYVGFANHSGVEFHRVETVGYTCKVTPPSGSKSFPIEIGPAAISVSCERDAPTDVVISGQVFRRQSRGVIQVISTAQTIVLSFPEEFTPALSNSVESVIAERLKKIEAQIKIIGDDQSALAVNSNNIANRTNDISNKINVIQAAKQNILYTNVFWKRGNNGSVTCSQFCRGPQWGGISGSCIGSLLRRPGVAVPEAYSCDELADHNGGLNLSCLCGNLDDTH